MEGTWGRRVYGSVRKGAKYTRFHLEITISNGLAIRNDVAISNLQLERYPSLYRHTLDRMTQDLDQRFMARL